MRFVGLALALLLASAATASAEDAQPDAAAGMRVFNKYRPCHQIGESARNQIGPALNGIVGRHSGIYPGYSYSSANKGSGLTWDEPTLRRYLHDPKAMVPGTKMTFVGIPREKDIDDVIAYLRQFDATGKIKTP